MSDGERQAHVREARVRSNRKVLLRTWRENGIDYPESFIEFLSLEESKEKAQLLWQRIRTTAATAVDAWPDVVERARAWLSGRSTVLLFHGGDAGSMRASGAAMALNLNPLVRLIGPDLYMSSEDLSSAFVFDKDESGCSLRIW